MNERLKFQNNNNNIFQVRDSPAPFNIPTPAPAPDWGGPVAPDRGGPVAFLHPQLTKHDSPG